MLLSCYFEVFFGMNWKESRLEEVEFFGFDENVVVNLVRFVYLGSIDIIRGNV